MNPKEEIRKAMKSEKDSVIERELRKKLREISELVNKDSKDV